MSQTEAVNDFVQSLNDLKTTNKANISMLTILADDEKQHAAEITKAIETRLKEVFFFNIILMLIHLKINFIDRLRAKKNCQFYI